MIPAVSLFDQVNPYSIGFECHTGLQETVETVKNCVFFLTSRLFSKQIRTGIVKL